MADSFDDLGIAEALVAGAEAAGWDTPSRIQRDAVPVIRRGNNVVLHASPGAGATGAWGLGILDRLADDDSSGVPAVLVLVSDPSSASLTARSLARLAAPPGIAVRAYAPGWIDRPAAVLVAAATDAVAAIRDSTLKLDGLLAVVIDGADRAAGLDAWGAIETLVDSTPADAQRVVVTGSFPAPVEDFIERHVRKAMTVPSRATEAVDTGTDADVAIRYTVVAAHEKLPATISLLPGIPDDEVAVVTRTRDAARRVAGSLRERGVAVVAPDQSVEGRRVLVLPMVEADRRSTRAIVLSYDVPFDADGLAELHRRGGAVVVTPRELPHLRVIAARAGLRLEAAPAPPGPALGAVEQIRQRLRTALAGNDLAAELALIEPLLAEHSAAEVAAAALTLVGTGTPKTPATAAADIAPAAAPPPATTWTRLFLTVGERDGVGPGDVVGAITGEAGVEGDQVGKIEIRESHSTVEVASAVAERVIGALNGRTLRGRSLRVDYDRKDRSAGRGPAGPGGRRGPGRGPGRGRPGGGPSRGGSGRDAPGRSGSRGRHG